MNHLQASAAADVIGALLRREEHWLSRLDLTSTPITTEIGWRTFDITLHACTDDGDDVTILVKVDLAGNSSWWQRNYGEESFTFIRNIDRASAQTGAQA